MRLASPHKPRINYFFSIDLCFCIGHGVADFRLANGLPPANIRILRKQSREAGPAKRIPRQMALTTGAVDGTVRETTVDGDNRPVGGATIQLRNLQTDQSALAMQLGDGVFRIFSLPPGAYEVDVEAADHAPFGIASLAVNANEVVTLEISITSMRQLGCNRGCHGKRIWARRCQPRRFRPPEPIGSFVTDWILIPITSWSLRQIIYRLSQMFTTRSQNAGRWSNRITGATVLRANTSMLSRMVRPV